MRAYETPEVSDFGTIKELTEATGFVNAEDGGNKLLIHHVDLLPDLRGGLAAQSNILLRRIDVKTRPNRVAGLPGGARGDL
jgi:hypothetical protein